MKSKEFFSRLIYLLVFSLLVITLLSGCGTSKSTQSQGSTSTEPRKGGVLKLGIGYNPVALGFAPDIKTFQEFIISAPAIETLGRFDETGKMQPLLAESWQSDPNAKTITIKLKKDIKFHDGTDFNSEAVKWNLEQFLKAGRAEAKGLKSVDIVDGYTVRLNLAGWNNGLLDALSCFVPMVSPTAFNKNGKEWADKNPVGTGPFQFVSWDRDTAVKYKKFEGYWQQGKPYLDGIEWRIITDPMTAAASFKAKELSVFVNLPSETAKQLEESGASIVKNKSGLGTMAIGVISDSANPESPFANIKVRQAVSHAIDVKAIVESLLHGYGTLTTQWGAPGSWSYNPDVKGYPYNPDNARQLLAEAGYPNGFKTKLTTLSLTEEVKVMTAVQGYLAKVGIDAQLEQAATGRYTQITGNQTAWDGLILYRGRGDADVTMYMPRNFSAKGVLFVKGIIHPEKIEKLLYDAAAAPDFETKKNLAQQLQKSVYDEYALLTPIYISTLPAAKYKTVHNDGINAAHASAWTPENAWIE